MDSDVRLDHDQAEDLHRRATNQGQLVMWIVTWNTSDYPQEAAARPHFIGPGTVNTQKFVLLADTLDELRQQLPSGLDKLDRAQNDDPVIIEIWI